MTGQLRPPRLEPEDVDAFMAHIVDYDDGTDWEIDASAVMRGTNVVAMTIIAHRRPEAAA